MEDKGLRKIAAVLSVLVMLLSSIAVFYGHAPIVKAADEIFNGDLILTGNNVTTIENRIFHINGSIIVTENATLILRNAVVNFTQTAHSQFNMTFKNPNADGNPRLKVENATITTNGYQLNVYMDMPSSANVADVNGLNATDYICFYIWGETLGEISNSRINFIHMQQYARLEIANSIIEHFHMSDYAECQVYDSYIDYGYAYGDSRAWFVNTTIPEGNGQVYNNSVVYLSWYVDLYVTDFVGQKVSGANLTAYYSNGTIADSALTDINGWSRLTLMAGFVNATGFFPAENYTFTLEYVTAYSHLVSIGSINTQMPNNNINETVSLGFFYSYPASFDGDLHLGDNEFLLIEGLLNINGSITVMENARLILDNARINFTQTMDYQFKMEFTDNTQLTVENSNITSGHFFDIYFRGNSSATIDMALITSYHISLLDYSKISISKSTLQRLYADQYADLSAINCTMRLVSVSGNASCTLSKCTLSDSIYVYATSINATISNLGTGHISSWNLLEDCNVEIAPTGSAPNITVTDTYVAQGFSFTLSGTANTTIIRSKLQAVYSYVKAKTSIHSSQISYFVILYHNAYCYLEDTSIGYGIYLYDNSEAWCFNVTSSMEPYVIENAVAYVGWWLNIHVIDQEGNIVPDADINITDAEGRPVAWGKTNQDGWAKFSLLEKIVNATGPQTLGNYTVEASYNGYHNSESVRMDGNKEITLQLPFIIPEFPPAAILLALLALVTATIYAGKKLKTK